MGSSASKPVRSAAQAVSRRQYPKQPATPSPPSTTAPRSQRPPPPPPSREPTTQRPSHGPKYHPKEQASTEKSSAIDLDGRDPHFAASLRSIGPVTPAPTLSHSSTFTQTQAESLAQKSHPASASGSGSGPGPLIFPKQSNPALLAVTARQRITREAEAEAEALGQDSFAGRSYLDAFTIRQALAMRDTQGLPGEEIERVLRLKGGTVERLGSRKVIGIP
ncbi:uncharacterized protein BJX67DRAFT_344954 [Aspergillus lucknowensis]|uniref:Helix-turn-helix domain-containing protein n=1 Tax=Aspergillus lucknowensis TaxID=176173 RepID=A0ABR4M0R7_9EURO